MHACLETSVANDMEILLIQKLRETCGCDFVSKLQKMLKDKLLSKVSLMLILQNARYFADVNGRNSITLLNHGYMNRKEYYQSVMKTQLWPSHCIKKSDISVMS